MIKPLRDKVGASVAIRFLRSLYRPQYIILHFVRKKRNRFLITAHCANRQAINLRYGRTLGILFAALRADG